MMQIKRKERKPFHVFEAGHGKRPTGLVNQAVRAEQRGLRERHFAGADVEAVNLDRLLKRLKIEKKPANLTILQKCAVEALEGLKPGSQDIVFGSYLANILSLKTAPDGNTALIDLFFKAAKHALKPGGRLVLVQDKAHIDDFMRTAQALGMGFHPIELTDEKARKSQAKFIRARATPDRRMARLVSYAKGQPDAFFLQFFELREAGRLKTEDDFARPTLMIFRKLRAKEPEKPMAVLASTVDLLEDPAIRKAVRGILR